MTATNANPDVKPMTPKVLVVEDDHDQRQLICEALEVHFAGCSDAKVAGVATGQECLRQNLADFNVILLDYHLPDIKGLDLLERITAGSDIPVVFVTGENDTATAAEAIRRGANDYVVKLGDYLFALPLIVEKNIRQHQLQRENRQLHVELTSSLEQIRVKNFQLEDSLRKMRTMAASDALTGLNNRRAFAEALRRCFDEANRYDFDLACVMCDLDHYKSLNDTLGHQIGDQVLVATAQIITANLRSSDTAARYGGDEFVVLLPHTSVDMAIAVGERIRLQLAATTQRLVGSGSVTLSLGVASLKSDRPVSADTLVAMADRALYVAKEHGKNRIITFGEIGAVPNNKQ